MIAWRGGWCIPLTFFAIRTTLLGFSDDVDRKTVSTQVECLGLLVGKGPEIHFSA